MDRVSVGIVGGGIAGLATAWLLSPEMRVVVFEKNDVPGGHAHSLRISRDEGDVVVDTAAAYFSSQLHPHFLRLLDALGVRTRVSSMTMTIFSPATGVALMSTPDGWNPRTLTAFRPRNFRWLLEFYAALRAAAKLELHEDWDTTLRQLVEGPRLTESFKTRLFYPFAASLGGVTVETVMEFSARAALTFAVRQQPQYPVSQIQMYEVVDGVETYVRALADRLEPAAVKCGTRVRDIRGEGGQFVITEANGISHRFDHVVLAVPGHDALPLTSGLAGSERCRDALSGFSRGTARMAVHGDLRYLPARRSDWSFFNVMSDVSSAQATFWPGRAMGENIFRSWVAAGDQLPAETYGLYSFEHPLMTPAYFRSQNRLAAEQGNGKLWFVGGYTRDIDSHENALLSALAVAQKIGSPSARFAQISQESRPEILTE